MVINKLSSGPKISIQFFFSFRDFLYFLSFAFVSLFFLFSVADHHPHSISSLLLTVSYTSPPLLLLIIIFISIFSSLIDSFTISSPVPSRSLPASPFPPLFYPAIFTSSDHNLLQQHHFLFSSSPVAPSPVSLSRSSSPSSTSIIIVLYCLCC